MEDTPKLCVLTPIYLNKTNLIEIGLRFWAVGALHVRQTTNKYNSKIHMYKIRQRLQDLFSFPV